MNLYQSGANSQDGSIDTSEIDFQVAKNTSQSDIHNAEEKPKKKSQKDLLLENKNALLMEAIKVNRWKTEVK